MTLDLAVFDLNNIIVKFNNSCNVCNHKHCHYISLCLVNNIPYDVIKKNVPDVPSYEIVKNHKNHITIGQSSKELSLIKNDENDNIDINELNVIDSTIRTLTAKRIEMENSGLNYGQDYIMIIDELFKWTKLKLEVKKKLGDKSSSQVNIANVIKLPNTK